MTKTPTFRDWELAEQHDAAKRRRQMRRMAHYDTGAQSLLGVLDAEGRHAQSAEPENRAYRIANQMLSGRGQ